jgi:hypothetical protein
MSKTLTLTHYEYKDNRNAVRQTNWPPAEVVRVDQTVHVGQRVQVWSFGRNRDGVVTKLGRTRATVSYPQNRQGVRNVKAFTGAFITVPREHVKRTPWETA